LKDTPKTAVPGKRLGWAKTELDAAGVPYKIERVGKEYHVHAGEQASPVLDDILNYRAKPKRKLSWWQRLKGFLQIQIYFVEELVAFLAVLAVLLYGVYFFGLGNLPSEFALLYGENGTSSWIYPARAVALLLIAVGILFALNKTVGKPAGGMPRGHGTMRFLDILLIGTLVTTLLMAWLGRI